MKILITGGAGFQGSHIVEECIRSGHEVTVLNTFSFEAEQNLRDFENDTRIVWGSVTDEEIVEKTIRGQDAVIHLAARINVDESIDVPRKHLMANVIGTNVVLEAVRRQGCRLVYASSCEVYGSAGGAAISEQHELRPHSPYAASKAGADRLCFAYWKTYATDITIVRPCNIYGPKQKGGVGGAVIAIFVDRALAGRELTVFGTGEQRREYMYVDDLVAGYMQILERPDLSGEVINLGTGETPSVLEIANIIGQRLGVAIEHAPPRAGEVDGFFLDSSKAQQLGIRPGVRFVDGVEKYINWRRGKAGS